MFHGDDFGRLTFVLYIYSLIILICLTLQPHGYTSNPMNSWNNTDRPLILASRSLRRKNILESMGFNFSVVYPLLENEERLINRNELAGSIQKLALHKGMSVAHMYKSSCIFSGDTIVAVNGRIIGKPSSMDDARQMLRTLSGKSHKVFSGVALVCKEIDFSESAIECTDVYFREITDREIDDYLQTDEYADKAGAYAIQGKAMAFIDKINGCFYNVMGLPVSKKINLLKAYQKRK